MSPEESREVFGPISINFHRGVYRVEFRQGLRQTLLQEIRPGDIIFADSNVLDLYSEIRTSIPFPTTVFPIVASEQNKDLSLIPKLIESVLSAGFRPGNRLVAIGGGIIQDIVSFSASILHRGVEWIFFPTTLLAQADSCIGGKSSINFGNFKNQIGGFFPPSKILCVEDFLYSLSDVDFRSGIGEIAHYFCLQSANIFESFAETVPAALEDRQKAVPLVHETLLIKKGFIEQDEFDVGRRKLLNFGHSFAHAIESASAYQVPHGIAVAYGIDLAFRVSESLEMVGAKDVQKVWGVIGKIVEKYEFPNVEGRSIVEALARDKKNTATSFTLILTRGLGLMEVVTLGEIDIVRALLEDRLRAYTQAVA